MRNPGDGFPVAGLGRVPFSLVPMSGDGIPSVVPSVGRIVRSLSTVDVTLEHVDHSLERFNQIRFPILLSPFLTTGLDSEAADRLAQPASRDRPRHLGLPTESHELASPFDGPHLGRAHAITPRLPILKALAVSDRQKRCAFAIVEQESNRLAEFVTLEPPVTS
jgi:hypothetical protein